MKSAKAQRTRIERSHTADVQAVRDFTEAVNELGRPGHFLNDLDIATVGTGHDSFLVKGTQIGICGEFFV